ncbi:MAG: isoleucine--tRNA ligase [Candidatus Moranbacteria bacterium]|nr:isoleucine--tRNA ligase [Candidatus Moranbacteria bacterium]
MEKEIIQFWKDDGTFQKSIEQKKNNKYFSFYDGPPFITGVPHYGTLLSSIVKDAVPRYWTMKGYRVERRWGWDCHGLPAENMVEKKLGIKNKREIEEKVGIATFVEECIKETSQIASEWETVIDRVGRWVEFKNAYKTMDKNYMESVWWAFSQLHKKGLIYEDVRVSLYCPRCSTPLSNFEIAMDNSYEMDSDPSVYVKMKINGQENSYFLVWTTTPWTLLANVALAVGGDIDYVKVRYNDKNGNPEFFILAKNVYEKRRDDFFPGVKNLGPDEVPPVASEIVEEFKGNDLLIKEYESIFPHEIENGYKVIAADFVTTDDGSGIVHIAPAFGEDDFQVRKSNDLPIIMNVNEEGQFTDGLWSGQKVWDANNEIVKWLKENNILFKREQITHSYPHCHRCHTKLIYKAQPAWYVNVSKIRKDLIAENEKINWFPEFLKHGRFQNGIEGAPDWNISRDRYFGTAIPVWKCDECDEMKVFGSYEELKNASGIELDDYHRPKVDDVTFACEKCHGKMKRIPQVFDSWIESGSMPFAQFHYPFENKEVFEKSFPTDFISEYIAQTRAWFYVLHVLSVGIFGKISFKNVVTTGTIAGNDGKKMSKSLGNYTLPDVVLEQYSADALRLYLLSSPLLNAQNISFSEKSIQDIQRKVLSTLWNSYAFFTLYADVDKWTPKNNAGSPADSDNLLDLWIVSELNKLIREVDTNMEAYELVKAIRPFENFVDNLSNWYIRRSRKRFWRSENDDDKGNAYQTLHYVLVTLSKIMAPFAPFISEEIYKNLTGLESVHLEDFPIADAKRIDEELNNNMSDLREIITIGLQDRAKNKIKVRQPLSGVFLGQKYSKVFNETINKPEWSIILTEELNVKGATLGTETETVAIDSNITAELKLEGQAREIVRYIQEMRKEAGYEVDNHIIVGYSGVEEVFNEFGDLISREILADKIQSNNLPEYDLQKEFTFDEKVFSITIKKL